eukprot:TRINITY_DN185_c0_g1_i1.p1 TRINITY_DN185_c0_g1~~TRINITY_DN185_c0_g1_i1.p1  ORF type:complete len:200 (+),score=56.71 TRINITY_DN185_c0_g1_i1:224-823(+)
MPSEPTIKCVSVGDGGVGKTSMLVSFTTNSLPDGHIATVFDNHNANIQMDKKMYNISLWDTAGQEEYDRLRPLSYPQTDVFLLCFDIVHPPSLDNIITKWIPEITQHCPQAKFVLVGTKADLRGQKEQMLKLKKYCMSPVTFEQGQQAAIQFGASSYVECSAVTQKGLSSVFEEAVKAVFGKKRSKGTTNKKKKDCSII